MALLCLLHPPAPYNCPQAGDERGKCCSEHGVETALDHFWEAEHPLGMVEGKGTHFTPSQGAPIEPQDLGRKSGELPGSNSCPRVGPVDLQLAGQTGQGAGAGGGLQP